jgi:hypothetical protein
MIGMTFDSIGGLYLAYDLLGGQDGPLSRVTRIVNYSLLFFLIMILGFNLKFALIGSIGLGTATAFHMHRISHNEPETTRFLFCIALLRGLTIFWATSYVMSLVAATIGGIGLFLVSFLLPRYSLTPKLWYTPGVKPSITPQKILFSCIIGLTVTVVLTIGEYFGHDSLSLFGSIRTALVLSLSLMAVTIFAPAIEWFADNVPDKRMGYVGAIMFMMGFVIQSIPSLIILLQR